MGRWSRSGVMWFPDRLRTTLWRCQSIVWIASWLVPRDQRAAWRSEHNRKFWHWCHFLSESGQLTPQNRLIIAQHCWATFPHAFWIRFDRERFYSRSRILLGSPLTFLGALALGLSALFSPAESCRQHEWRFPRRFPIHHKSSSSPWTVTESTATSAGRAPTPCWTWRRSGASRS